MDLKEIPLPDPERLPPDSLYYHEIIELHTDACLRGEDFYEDPATGYLVMTALFLKNRGNCCNAGCRHCPYLSS